MEKTAMTYATEALMSSKKQFDRLAVEYETENHILLGSIVFEVCHEIQKFVQANESNLSDHHFLFRNISLICGNWKEKHQLFHILEKCCHAISLQQEDNMSVKQKANSHYHLNKKSSGYLATLPDDRYRNKTDNQHLITISSDEEDDIIPFKRIKLDCKASDSVVSRSVWIRRLSKCRDVVNELLRLICHKIDNASGHTSKPSDCVCMGLWLCIEIGIYELQSEEFVEKSNSEIFTTPLEHFTTSIEMLANQKYSFHRKILESCGNVVDLNSDCVAKNGCLNPAIQIMATLFRALLEAEKFHNEM